MADNGPVIDPAHFRQVLGHFPSGVCVVTTVVDGAPAGFALGSFASVSLDPPLVLFCAANVSSTLERITRAGAMCVNVLAEDQEAVCRNFASKSTDKFAGVGWQPSGNGCPRLDGVLAHIDAHVSDQVVEGDHTVVIGRVTDLAVHHEGGPLLYYRGGYGRFVI